jgi:hypothetical protein
VQFSLLRPLKTIISLHTTRFSLNGHHRVSEILFLLSVVAAAVVFIIIIVVVVVVVIFCSSSLCASVYNI